MYIKSNELLNRINLISKEIYDKSKGIIVFEEYIILPCYGNIILRFNINKENYTLKDLDKYESLMVKCTNGEFLTDFMGSVYKKVGLNPQEFNNILQKCYEKYKNEVITKSIYEDKIKKDAMYLLELCSISKYLDVWEIQLEEEINLLVLGESFKELGNYSIDELKINVYEVSKLECEGLMKATMYAKNHYISLVRALLTA